MVDVDRHIPPSFSAGLRRLSSRASTTTTTLTTPRSAAAGLHSIATFSSSLLSHLSSTLNIPLSPGLSEPELSRIESLFNFSFPPDLRSLLSLALPSSPSFPNWRSLPSLPSLFHLPTTSFLLHLSATSAWPTSSWGPHPVDPEQALSDARSNLRRAPLLIPLFCRCYIPSKPSLAGNPIFYVDDTRIFCCAADLHDFFSSGLVECGGPELNYPLAPIDRIPRWIEFWTEAASHDRRRRERSRSVDWMGKSSWSSSCSSVDLGPDPESYVEIRNPKGVPEWVERYMARIGAALKEGGWGEEEVEEMVHVSGSCWMGGCEEGEVGAMVMDVRAERWGDELRTAGWSSEEVADVLGLGKEKDCNIKTSKRVVKLTPGIQMKVEKLAQEFLIKY